MIKMTVFIILSVLHLLQYCNHGINTLEQNRLNSYIYKSNPNKTTLSFEEIDFHHLMIYKCCSYRRVIIGYGFLILFFPFLL